MESMFDLDPRMSLRSSEDDVFLLVGERFFIFMRFFICESERKIYFLGVD